MGCRHFFVSTSETTPGRTLIEYALLAGFISVGSVAIIINIGTSVNTFYTNVNSSVTSAAVAAS